MAKNPTRIAGEQARSAVALATENSDTAKLAAVRVGASTDNDSGQRLKVRERLAYGFGDVGGNLIFAPVSAFLLFYLTDIAGIGAAIAGTLLLLGRVLDGTLDLIVGTLIDRTDTRWGKARPWILFSAPVLVVSFILLFNVPAGLSTTGDGISSGLLAAVLGAEHGIAVRSGRFCAHPLVDRISDRPLVRVSTGVGSTLDDIHALGRALRQIVSTGPRLEYARQPSGEWQSVDDVRQAG